MRSIKHDERTCVLRASAAVTFVVGIGVVLAAIVSVTIGSIGLVIGAGALDERNGVGTFVRLASPTFLAPAAILVAFGLVYLSGLALLRRRRALGVVVAALGVAVLFAMGALIAAAWRGTGDVAPPILFLAWLGWSGVVLVVEGRHLRRGWASGAVI